MDHELHPALTATGRFRVNDCLGSGAFGVVFDVYDTHADARLALKWLRTSDASTIARFHREFRSLANLVHPNLVRFRELITVAGEWFFTMDLVVGQELLHFVRPATAASVESRSQTALLPPCAADLRRLGATLEQLGAGLDALHARGMLHRDVKPSNVLVTGEGRVVLLDFGLVTEMGADGVAPTETGNIVGSPGYMSPEQAMGTPLTPASDWYAVGVILYQALTGRLPFEDEPHALLIRKQLVEARSPSASVHGVPQALAELCSDLLAIAPERRPVGAAFAARLRRALEGT